MSTGEDSFGTPASTLPIDTSADTHALSTSAPNAPHSPTTPGASRPRSRRQRATNGHGLPAPAASVSPATRATAAETLAQLRAEVAQRYTAEVAAGAAPIRVMARMANEVRREAATRGLPQEVIEAGVINRTIGDVNLRRISPVDDGPEFVTLADDMGIALPGEEVGGHQATGETYRWLHERMLEIERQLLARGFDLRVYDLSGTGNPILREMLAAFEEERYGITLDPTLIYLSIGSLDGLDKFWRGYAHVLRQRGVEHPAVIFPAPGFNVPEWQAVSFGMRLHRLYTRPEDRFKVTPDMLRGALDEAPDIHAFYLTVSNNPTAFAYTHDELCALFEVIQQSERDVVVVADLAYIGTGEPQADRARMEAFADSGVLPRTVLAHSFSKTHTLTGDRCGWVAFSDAQLAAAVGPGWTNSMASLPAEWQLRYTAWVQLFRERPELEERVRKLYAHRRRRLVAQLHDLDARYHLFAQVNLDDGGTIYNWSQLRPGEDVFTLFARTGIAGVPGSGFGYSNDFVRFSVGWDPVPPV